MKFSDSLDRRLEEIKRPPNPPIGHYVWQINKHPDIDEFTSRGGDDFEKITFQIACVSPGEDVDADELAEYGKIVGYRNRKEFLFADSDEDQAGFDTSMFNLRRFLGHCGIDEKLSLTEALAASVGTQFLGELTHNPDPNDTEVIYARVGTTTEAS